MLWEWWREWWCYESARVTWHSWHLWHVWPVSRSRAMASVTRSAPGNLWSITRLLLPRDENRSQHTGHLLRTRAMMTLLWMSDIFLKSHRPEWTIGWRLAGMGLFRTHQVTLSWVGPELISNNIILDIIPRLSKAASDTKFDILPQFTYTYAFNLPQTPNFLA